MDTNKLMEILRRNGVVFEVIRTVIIELQAHEEQKKTEKDRLEDRDWDKLLAPLKKQIQNLGGSGASWRKTPKTAEVYSQYLILLRKVRDKIKNAQRVAQLRGQTITEAAAERGITEQGGRKWAAWVPFHVRQPFIAAIDNLPGKHITPFLTSMEKTASNKRWVIVEASIARHRALYHPHSIAQRWLTLAEKNLNSRETTTPAPLNWAWLLPPIDRKNFLTWKRRTKNGATEFAADTDTQQ